MTRHRRPTTVSVVLDATSDGHDPLDCAAKVLAQLTAGDELLIVAPDHYWSDGRLAGHPGIRLLRGCLPMNEAAALNLGARQARGDGLAFVGPHARPEPEWLDTVSAALASGPSLVAASIGAIRDATRSPAHQVVGLYDDLAGLNGFLPWARATDLSMRRNVFESLGGFDEALPGGAGRDLCYRAQLAGYRLEARPALVSQRPTGATKRQMTRRGSEMARTAVALRFKYRQFAFHDAVARSTGTPLVLDPRSPVLRRLLRPGLSSPARPPVDWGLAASLALGTRLGTVRGWLDIVSGAVERPAPLAPALREAPVTSTLTTPPPVALVAGRDVLLMGLVRRLLQLRGISAAPAGLETLALPRWDEPPPWSLRMTRLARCRGWRINVELAAQSLERGRPETWGAAYQRLLAIEAWLHGRSDHVVVAEPRNVPALLERLGPLPVVSVGSGAPTEGWSVRLGRSDVIGRPRTWPIPLLGLVETDPTVQLRTVPGEGLECAAGGGAGRDPLCMAGEAR